MVAQTLGAASRDMREQLEQRLQTLKADFARGQEQLSKLENEALRLRETLLRISGAIQVLEEELKDEGDSTPESAA